MIKLLVFLLLPSFVYANYAEFFGASPQLAAIGNQANNNAYDPSNNVQVPAILAFGKKMSINFFSGLVTHNFEPLSKITTINSTNSNNSDKSYTESTSLDITPSNLLYSGLHLALPLGTPWQSTLGLSIMSPVKSLMNLDSGDPISPEYVLYNSRNQRFLLYANYAHKLSDKFSFSLGTHMGTQTSGTVNMNTSLGSSSGSTARTKADVSPSLALISSFYLKEKKWGAYFSYTQEMKSNMKFVTSGRTDIPPVPYQMTLDTMLFYDPHIFRFGGNYNLGFINFFGSLEYQIWKNYKTPIMRVTKKILIESSANYEQVKTQNIVIPHFGISFDLLDSFSLHNGLTYRPTPLKGDFSGPGNSVDTSVLIISSGAEYKSRLFDKSFAFTLNAALHKLFKKEVVKSKTQENNNSGVKIGAPGYTIGGNLVSLQFGMKIEF